jgi:hypothetical protein
MNKQDLARILIRVLGVSMIAHGVPSCVAALITIFWSASESRVGMRAYLFTSPALAFLTVAIGLHLFFKGAWIAKKLVHIDEKKDL